MIYNRFAINRLATFFIAATAPDMSIDLPTCRPPVSNRVCDAVCMAGALWTLACHFTVVTAGNMNALLITVAVLVISATGGWIIWGRRRRSATELPASKSSMPSSESSNEQNGTKSDISVAMRIGISMAGIVIAGAYGLTGDIRNAWWLLVPWLAFVAWRHWGTFDRVQPYQRSRGTEIALWLLALMTASVSLVAHRPNIDDAFYLALATGAADHPDKPVYGFDPLYGTDATEMRPPYYRVLSIELLAATVSRFFSIPVIAVMHIVFATFAALMIPLAAARLLRLLAPATWFWCTAALMVVLVADGDAPTSYGNMSLVRMQQTKSLMLMVVLPLAMTYSLELMRTGSLRAWLLLAASLIFGLGCSPTAMVLFPAVSGLTMLAAWQPSRQATMRLAAGVATSIYPVTVAVILITLASQLPTFESNWKENAGDATNYAYLMNYMFRQVFGVSWLGMFVLWVIASAWVFFETATARRTALVLSLGCLLVFFNPWMSIVASGHPSLIATYWRVLWIIPLPVMLAMFLMSPQSMLGKEASLAERSGIFVAAMVGFIVLISGRSVLTEANGTELRAPGLKVDERYSVAKQLCKVAPQPAQIVAPEEVSGWVTTQHNHPYPLASRIRYLRAYAAYISHEEMLRRYYLQGYVSGQRRPEPSDVFFRQCLKIYPQLEAVCLSTDSEWVAEAREILAESNFEPVETPGPYQIWRRVGS